MSKPKKDERLAIEKAALRERMKPVRDKAAAALDPERFAAHLEVVVDYLQRLADCEEGYIATYVSVGSEFPTALLNARLRVAGFRLCVLCWDAEAKVYVWGELTGDLVPGPHGIPQPAEIIPVDDADIALALAPGLAFALIPDTFEFARLGHGGGVYDRILARLEENSPMSIALGLCFNAQVVPSVPQTAHDYPVCQLITEDAFGQADEALRDMEDEGIHIHCCTDS